MFVIIYEIIYVIIFVIIFVTIYVIAFIKNKYKMLNYNYITLKILPSADLCLYAIYII